MIRYQNHDVSIDLRRIVAINHPNAKDGYFCVFFDGFVWKVSVSEHDRLYSAWLNAI